MVGDHSLHLLLLTIPTFLGLLLFRDTLLRSFCISLKKGLITAVVVLILVHFGFSETAMAFHQHASPMADHFCCIVQPSLSSVDSPQIPPKPQALFSENPPQPLLVTEPVFIPHSSRAPPNIS
jgi:hypothetical protein